MTALIVGGDHIESLRKAISDRGLEKVEHWNGRKPGDLRKCVPKNTKLIVILYDSLSHKMLKKVNADTSGSEITMIHCRRSLGQLCRMLDDLEIGGSCEASPDIGGDGCNLCMVNENKSRG